MELLIKKTCIGIGPKFVLRHRKRLYTIFHLPIVTCSPPKYPVVPFSLNECEMAISILRPWSISVKREPCHFVVVNWIPTNPSILCMSQEVHFMSKSQSTSLDMLSRKVHFIFETGLQTFHSQEPTFFMSSGGSFCAKTQK